MIGIVDYGLGNVGAFLDAFDRISVEALAVSNEVDLYRASKLILPGVGTFDGAMGGLRDSGLMDALNHQVLVNAVPILGVCVGFQMMMESSEEGIESGLGWLKGDVRKIPAGPAVGTQLLPHMGWNDIELSVQSPLFEGLTEARFYFLHSYCAVPENHGQVLAQSHYGEDFTVAAARKNIYGTQFHPEKSHHWGLKLLRNFAKKIAC
jgi:glutamine amidotransferase